jgi:hypothetical protein
MRFENVLVVGLFMLAATSFTGPTASAQQGNAPGTLARVPATVVLTEELPEGTPFRILRRVDASPRDVILLADGADAAAFSEAVEQLVLLRQVQGDTSRISGAMRVQRQNKAVQVQPRVLPWAQRVLNDLHLAAPRLIEGVGNRPAVQIWLPSGRRPGGK